MTEEGGNTLPIKRNVFAIQAVTLACHAVIQSEVKPPSPKPAWFDGFQNDLDEAKSLAKQWVNDLSQNTLKVTLESVIELRDASKGSAQQVLEILNAPAGEMIPAKLTILGQQLEKINTRVDAIIERSQALQVQMRDWSEKMIIVNQKLQQRVAEIQSSQSHLFSRLEVLRQAISDMETEVKKGVGDGLDIGILNSIAIGVNVGVTAAINVVFPPFGWFMELISPEVQQSKVHPLIARIRQARDEFSEKERHYADLTLLSSSMGHTTEAIRMVIDSMNKLQTMWCSFRLLLVDAQTSLKKSYTEKSLNLIRMNLHVAFSQWEEAAKTATNLLKQQTQP